MLERLLLSSPWLAMAFALDYYTLFLVTGSWFILGGAFACFATSRHFRDWVVVKA